MSAPESSYRQVVQDSFARWYDLGKDSWSGASTTDSVTDFVCEQALPLQEDARPGKPLRVLDIGCGRALQSLELAGRLGAEVTAVDLLDVRAEEAVASQIRFHHGEFLEFEDAGLDLLVDNGCLHHQSRESWPAWVRHGHDMLRPQGRWAVNCFLSPTAETTAVPLQDGRLNWWLTPEALVELYAEYGFTETGRTVIDRDFQYQGHWLKYLAVCFVKG